MFYVSLIPNHFYLLSLSAVRYNFLVHSFRFQAMAETPHNKTGSLDEQQAWKKYFDYLVTTLKEADASARARAARILGENKASKAAPALTALLMDDPDMHVRQVAAVALGRIGAVEPLINALHAPNMQLRLLVVQALTQIGDPRAAVPLIEALRDTNAEVRNQAAFALNKLGANAVEPLLEALRSENAVVRWNAARVLGGLGDKRALPELERLAHEDHTPVNLPRQTGELRASQPLTTVSQAAQQAAEKLRSRK
jgi:HEAT repeat protein